MAAEAPQPIDTGAGKMPIGAPQVRQIDLRGTVGGAGVGATGISDAVANRRPDQPLGNQQRPSPANLFSDRIAAHVEGGQAGLEAIQRMVLDPETGIRSTADSSGDSAVPRATTGSGGTVPQSRPSREREGVE
jgi:hypothetical protein